MIVHRPGIFLVLVVTATVMGFLACALVNYFHTTPEIVNWCIAASAGYFWAEIIEVWLIRPRINTRAHK